MSSLKPYFVFVGLAIGLYLITFGMYQLSWLSEIPSYLLEIILFILFITAFIYKYVTRFAADGPDTVTRFYLLSIALKLMAGCAFVVLIALFDEKGAHANVILFLIAYGIFTFAEVVLLLRMNKS
jgi:predicted permease